MFNRINFLITCIFLIVLMGCSMKRAELTIVSTKDMEYNVIGEGVKVEGIDCTPVFVGPIGLPDLKKAIDMAIESAGPEYDALTDITIHDLNQQFLIGRICVKVEGTAIKTKNRASSKNDKEGHKISHSKTKDEQ